MRNRPEKALKFLFVMGKIIKRRYLVRNH